MARKFLYLVATLIVLVIAAGASYALWGDKLMRVALVPSADFVAPQPRTAADYRESALWLLDGSTGTLPLPKDAPEIAPVSTRRRAAIFYVHPTSYINRAAWNAPVGDVAANELAAKYVAYQASIFSGLGHIWAPRYRQATFGAFLTDAPESKQALDAAYADVAAAFDAFLAANPKGPIILAGHSQGSLLLIRLLHDKVAGTPVASRIAAAYIAGWPISVSADLPALGLPACHKATDTGCILSWQSFAQPADFSAVQAVFDAGNGFTGAPRRGTGMLCTNPLTGGTGTDAAPETANLGMAKSDMITGKQAIMHRGVGAACNQQGFLILDRAADLGAQLLPGNNYHVYDYALFWANVRADARRRLTAFRQH